MCLESGAGYQEMKIAKCIIIFLTFLLASCAASLPYRSLSGPDVRDALSSFPTQEDHPDATAVFLLNYGSMEMSDDGTQVYKHIVRCKILNERGYYLAKKSIGYRENYSRIKILYANTIKPDGTAVPLKEEDIIDSAAYSQYEEYTDIKEKKFTMPAIEPNCIVEYAYEVQHTRPFLLHDYYTRFALQEFFPVKERVMEIILPANRNLHIAYFKTDIKPTIEESDGKVKYTFTNRDSVEIIPEPNMPGPTDKDVFPQVHCWTLSCWDVISKWYAGLVKEQMQSDEALVDFTRKLVAGKTKDEEKIRAIFDFVARKIRYMAVEIGPHTMKPHPARDVFKKKYGDCKDKTTLLLTMLKTAGIEGRLALVPKDPDTLDEDAPSMSYFNHVIAAVPRKDGTFYWLDATNVVASTDSVPFLVPSKVLLINEDGSYQFVKTPDLDDRRDYTDLVQRVHVKESGDAEVDNIYSSYGKCAEAERNKFRNLSPRAREQHFEAKGIELHELDILNLDELDLPFIVKANGLMRNEIHKVDDNEMILSGAAMIRDYDELTAVKLRRYPLRFTGSGLVRFKKFFYFPKGYRIRKMPSDYKIEDPYNINEVKYRFIGNVFIMEGKTKDLKYTLKPGEFKVFKERALERKKYRTSVRNIIFERK